ncbi:hypothetical protein HaLaN_18922, partial [Haematococcus lacustris]
SALPPKSSQAPAPAAPLATAQALAAEPDAFLSTLRTWLDYEEAFKVVPLSPGAPPLQLKTLLAKGGHASVTQRGLWGSLANDLQRSPGQGEVLRRLYEFWLLPLEAQVVRAGVRPSAVQLWLETKLRERSGAPYCEEWLRPSPGAVQRALRQTTSSLQ